MDTTFNRTVFGYWHQGREAAPDDIKRCWDLWARMNPNWDLRILEWEDVASDFEEFGVDGSKMSFNGVANIVRLHCLATQGGVWVDAYTVPLRPLDAFLPPLMTTGFFAYHDPYRKRLSENWFLAADKDNALVTGWRDKMVEYWRIPRRPMRFRRELDRGTKGDLARLAGHVLDAIQGMPSMRSGKRIYQPKDPKWAVDVTRGGGGRVTPYFTLAMLFDLLLEERPDLWREWETMPKRTSYDCLYLRHWKRNYRRLSPEGLRALCDATPMQKLALPTKLPSELMDVLVEMSEAAMP